MSGYLFRISLRQSYQYVQNSTDDVAPRLGIWGGMLPQTESLGLREIAALRQVPTSLRNPSEDAKQPLFTRSFCRRA